MKKIAIIAAIAALTAGTASFYGGMKYEQANVAKNFRQGAAAAFPAYSGTGSAFSRGRQNNQPNANAAAGEIISKDDKIITVNLRNGGSKIIFYDNSTKIEKPAEGDTNDLEPGETVFITGQTNQDGSITARFIQLRPADEF